MRISNSISRRDFLKLSGVGLYGLFASPLRGFGNLLSNQQGRVIYKLITVYDRPSLSGEVVKQYWLDTVIAITEATIGDDEPAYNRVWYRLGSEGYAHSGGIQPVRTLINLPSSNIPQGGQLAEVTVPYTDACWEPDENQDVAYRFYYETTHWVIGLTHSPNGTPWYQVLDDKWELVLFVLARHLRLIPPSELSTLSPDVPPEAKRVEVRTQEQVVIAYEWDRPVFMARTATGAEFSNGKFYTPLGRHKTFHKRPSRHMAAGNLAYNGFDLPGIPWVCYITESGIAFHGTYWHNDYGRPRSHGCINLTSQAAKWIYRWTLPAVPTNEQRAYDEFATRVDIV
ncbi:MAG: L,D-transpeptidase [Chloroflexi bacterium]|nr:L,D-transpeptidase [Chloroflexota bacterium]